jgi:hypothetical protein
MNGKVEYRTFKEFYPFYLGEHSNRTCRRLHFVGTSMGSLFLLQFIVTLNPWWILAGLACGYAFAWIGHFYFEKNRPATFTYPGYSFIGDWAMWRDILLGKIKF